MITDQEMLILAIHFSYNPNKQPRLDSLIKLLFGKEITLQNIVKQDLKEIQPKLETNLTSWTHPTWRLIHRLSLKMSLSDYAEFIEHLSYLIPCYKCRKHLSAYIRDNPPVNTFIWSYNLHQAVNRHKGKKGISFEDGLKMYSVQ